MQKVSRNNMQGENFLTNILKLFFNHESVFSF